MQHGELLQIELINCMSRTPTNISAPKPPTCLLPGTTPPTQLNTILDSWNELMPRISILFELCLILFYCTLIKLN